MYTTNLAKRMPDAYFAQLAASGMHHLNISVESLQPEIYERLRKGARHRVFQENWDKLLGACRNGPAPPRLRYNMMAYRSNLHELPGLVDLLFAEKLAWQVEVRYTFDEDHIPEPFRQSEYLRDAEWSWLEAQLAHHDPARLLLLTPPPDARSDGIAPRPAPPPVPPARTPAGTAPGVRHGPADIRPLHEAAATPASYPFGMRMDWNGTLSVYSEGRRADGLPLHTTHLETGIEQVEDVGAMIADLMR